MPTELPAVGSGLIGGEQEDRVPLCRDCIELLLRDAEAFWSELRRKDA